jgi:phosphoglycolate phosphatase
MAPARILAIGDSSNDAIAARAAGCPVLTVPYGYNHGEAVQTIQSDGIVGTLLEAARLLATENQH